MNLIKASLTDPEEECLSGRWLTCCHSKGLFFQSLHFHCADGPLWESHTQFRWRASWLSNYEPSPLRCNLGKKQSTESKSTQMGNNMKNFYRCLSDFDLLLNMRVFFLKRKNISFLLWETHLSGSQIVKDCKWHANKLQAREQKYVDSGHIKTIVYPKIQN